MNVLLVGVSSALLASILSGCGGGGGGPTPAPAPTPPPGPTTTTTVTPGPPTPPPSPPPCSGDCRDIKVLSYNLEWHSSHGGPDIVKTINSQGPFDLMGMQECEDVNVFVNQVGNGHWGSYQVQKGPGSQPSKPNQGDICLAWNSDVFDEISRGHAPVGIDGWATRQMQWVYLKIKGTRENVLFANTHGPVGQCIGQYQSWSAVADAYLKNTVGQMEPGDHLFFVGDFNCGGTPVAKKDPSGSGMDDIIKKMRKQLTDTAQASFFYPALFQPDRIWTLKDTDIQTVDWDAVCCTAAGSCSPTKMFYDLPDDPNQPRCIATPSDHMLLKGHYKVPVGPTRLNFTNKVVV